MGILIAQLQLTDSSDKTITGTWQFDRDGYGTLVVPHGTSFPSNPTTNEFFLRTDENKLYYYDGASWESLGGTTTFDGYLAGPDPAVSTDEAIIRWDGTTGRLAQNSSVTIDDSGNISTSGNITVSGTVDGVDVSNHNARHIRGGADEIDGDKIDIDFTPTNYSPTTSPGEVTNADELTAHLAGIDGYLSNISPGPNGVILITDGYSKRYNTISSALDDAASGNVVIVGPGTYAESITIPSGVQLRVSSGAGSATISGSATTGTRVTMGSSSALQGFAITCPTDSNPAISIPSSASGIPTVSEVSLTGSGSSGKGIVCENSCFLDRVRYLSGTCDTLIECDGFHATTINGILVLSGSITNVVNIKNSSVCTITELYTPNTPFFSCTNAILIDAGTLILSDSVISKGTNALNITSDSSIIYGRSCRFFNFTNDINVDSSVTDAELRLTGCELLVSKISAPADWMDSDGISIVFQDETEDDEGFKIFGSFQVGLPEKGKDSSFGEGLGFTRNIEVITTDSTATSTTDGGNFTDVTDDAISPSSSTFSFQGTSSNHTILICNQLQDVDGYLPFYGMFVKMGSQRAIVSSGGPHESFAFEYWDGSNWTECNTFCVHSTLYYRYANELFQRANTPESIRFGIPPDATWSSKTINGTTGLWIRIRIKSSITTAPTFEQFKLYPNSTQIGVDGTISHFGTARYKKNNIFTGNVFGESGGVSSGSFNVGSGGIPTGWSHQIKNSVLNSNGDAVYVQIPIDKGVCTSSPIYVKFNLFPSGSGSNIDFICSFLAREVEGNLEADESGGISPVERTSANTHTVTSDAAQTYSKTLSITADKIQLVEFGPFDIDDYYEGDFLFIRLEMDDDGPDNVNIGILGLEISYVLWTPGEKNI